MNRKSTMDELGRLDIEEFKKAEKLPLRLVLDDIRSLNNIGSIFRSADAFRIAHIHLCGITASPPHRDIQKTALGATESVDWTYHESVVECVTALREKEVMLYALEQTTESVDLRSFSPAKGKALALIIGNEVKGVSEEAIALCHDCIEIEQYGTKHSLNVAVSTGMAIFHLAGKSFIQD